MYAFARHHLHGLAGLQLVQIHHCALRTCGHAGEHGKWLGGTERDGCTSAWAGVVHQVGADVRWRGGRHRLVVGQRGTHGAGVIGLFYYPKLRSGGYFLWVV